MGIKEFLSGAQLGLQAKGLRMDEKKQAMLARMYEEQISSMQAGRQQSESQRGFLESAAQTFQQARAPIADEFFPGQETVRKPLDMSELAASLLPDLMRAQPGSIIPLLQMMQPGGGETPKTAISAILQKLGPDATIQDVIAAQKQLSPETDFEKGYADYIKRHPGAPRESYRRIWEKEGKEKDSQTYLLPDKTTALSFDGGRTYVGGDGISHKMPAGAVKITTTFTGPEMSMLRTQRQVEQEISPQAGQRRPEAMREVAISGTGPYSMLEAAVDKILGGFGVDLVIGKEGLFPDTQENRQMLRAIKQTGKNALMNSARGAIWEQKRIDELFPDPDRFFTNPRTEAQKFKVLRDTLMAERTHNNEAIVTATDPKVVSDLARSNVEIDRLLSLIGRDKTEVPVITNNEEFQQLPSGTKFKDPQGNIRMKP